MSRPLPRGAWRARKERCVPEHLAEPLLLRFAKEAQAAPLVRRFWRM
jgi:hypothetical protein